MIYDPLTTRLDPASGQFVRDPFPGNVIPADRLNAVARAMLAGMPVPTSGKSFNAQATLVDGPQYQQTLKVDHRWNSAWTTTGMYARQKTREPGSAFFADVADAAGDPGSSLLLRTVNFVALNNVLVPNNTTVISLRYGHNRFYDSGGNYPGFDAGTLGLPGSLVDALTFNTFPFVAIAGTAAPPRRDRRRWATTDRATSRTRRSRPAPRSRSSPGITR